MEQANFELTQDIVSLNPILEGVIASAGDQPGPGVGNPDVVRELVTITASIIRASPCKRRNRRFFFEFPLQHGL